MADLFGSWINQAPPVGPYAWPTCWRMTITIATTCRLSKKKRCCVIDAAVDRTCDGTAVVAGESGVRQHEDLLDLQGAQSVATRRTTSHLARRGRNQ